MGSSRTFTKKHWNVYKSSYTIFNIKKNQLHIFGFYTFFLSEAVTPSSQNVLKIFLNLSIIMKKHLWWLLIKLKPLDIPWLTLSFINRWRKFSIFLFTSVFTHVIFAKIMVSFICSVCYPYPITFIFFFYNVTTTFLYISCILGWWWYSVCPVILIMGCIFIYVIITRDSNPHAFYSFIKCRCLMNWMDGKGF